MDGGLDCESCKEAHVARTWRLRHKLGLGLTLVVGSVALLLVGTLTGLSSYFDTGRVTQRKIDEMEMVQQLRSRADLIATTPTLSDSTQTLLHAEREQITKAASTLR